MSDRLDPPPVTPPSRPAPAAPSTPFPWAAILAVGAAVILLGIAAWWLLGQRRGGDGGGGNEASVRLPSELGGSVSSAKLRRVFDAAGGSSLNTIGLRLKLDEPRVYKIDDRVHVTFTTDQDANCALFDRTSAGTITLVQEASSIAANETWSSDDMRVTAPTGKESFLLLCAPRSGDGHLDLSSVLDRGRGEWTRFFSAVREDFEVRNQ